MNQAINRNRFPPDFAFRLRRGEIEEIRRSRSQFVILKRGLNVKYAPYAAGGVEVLYDPQLTAPAASAAAP